MKHKHPIIIAKQLDGVVSKYLRLFLYVDEKGLEDIFEKQRIKISCPMRTNDATEAVAQNEFSQGEDVRDYGYICLSSVHDSPAMWGYYANRSRGACVVLDFPIYEHNDHQYRILKNGIDRLEPWVTWIEKIQYKPNRAKAKIKYFGTDEPNFELLTTKSKDWEHEQEYRIFYYLRNIAPCNIEISENKEGKSVVYYDTSILENITGVILGVNYAGSISDFLAKIKHARHEHELKGGYPQFYPIKDIPVIRASFDNIKFRYKIPIDEKRMPLIDDAFINQEFNKLLSVTWHTFRTHSGEAIWIAKKPLNVDGYHATIKVLNTEHEFVIFDSFEEAGTDCTLFVRKTFDNTERFFKVHTISQDNLNNLFKKAKASESAYQAYLLTNKGPIDRPILPRDFVL